TGRIRPGCPPRAHAPSDEKHGDTPGGDGAGTALTACDSSTLVRARPVTSSATATPYGGRLANPLLTFEG
ncbi:MAG: hypothetical protein ACRDPR_23295, partial [Nocardioidaceae bacterium]